MAGTYRCRLRRTGEGVCSPRNAAFGEVEYVRICHVLAKCPSLVLSMGMAAENGVGVVPAEQRWMNE